VGLVRCTGEPGRLISATAGAERRRKHAICVRMLGTEYLLADRQRALVERLRPRTIALGLKQAREVNEGHGGVRVLCAAHLAISNARL